MRRIKILDVADVEFIAFILAKKCMTFNEPIPDFSTRFPYVLESCLRMPFQTFGRRHLYSGIIKKSSILFYLIIKNHPFQNGNKRIAVTTLLVFLSENKKWINVHPHKLYEFAVEVAKSDPKEKNSVMTLIEKFISKHLADY